MANDDPGFLSLLPLLMSGGQLQSDSVLQLSKILEKYHRDEALTVIAGMLTLPQFQANCHRLETLALLAVANCRGKIKPEKKHFQNWLNRSLGARVAMMEDPPEDVFVANVITKKGDFNILGGLWDTPDAGIKLLIECIEQYKSDSQLQWLKPVYELLKLSDLMLNRLNLKRWHFESSQPKKPIKLPSNTIISQWKKRALFTKTELELAGIDYSLLSPFIFDEAMASELMQQANEESALNERPLINMDGKYLIALPTSISYAACRYLVKRAAECKQLADLQETLMSCVLRRASMLMRHGSRHGTEFISLPTELQGIEALCKSFVFKVGTRRYIHLLILPDSLEQLASFGLLSPTEFSEQEEAQIETHVSNIQNFIDTNFAFDSGHTVLLKGHLGQAYFGALPLDRPFWTYTHCRLCDLELLLQDQGYPIDKLILLFCQQKSLAEQGLNLPNTNGLLNLFAYWVHENFSLRASEVPHDKEAYLQIGTDFVWKLRHELRTKGDEHCEPTALGMQVHVVKSTSGSIFDSERLVPAYVSIPHLEAGHLSFCLNHASTAVWMTVLSNREDPTSSNLAFRVWEGLQLLIFRTLQYYGPALKFAEPAVEIMLDLRKIVPPQEARDNPLLSETIDVDIHRQLPVIRLKAHPAFLRLFSGVINRGEQILISKVIYALGILSEDSEFSEADCNSDALKILGGEDSKIIHIFESFLPIEYLLSKDEHKVFRRPDEHVGATNRSVFCWMPSYDKPQKLDLDASNQLLIKAVSNLVEQLSSKLKRFNRLLFIRKILHAHESLLKEQHRWRTTARAVRSLYGIGSGTSAANSIDRERLESKITLRALAEAAICECPASGGIEPDGYSIDEIYGLMCSLITLGRDSETIYFGFTTAGITIYPSGSYGFSANILDQVSNPVALERFVAGYEAAAIEYEDWVIPKKPSSNDEKRDELITEDYKEAFASEYKLEPSVFLDITASLLDLAVEQDSNVVITTKEEICRLCRDREISDSDVESFLHAFSLTSRPTWNAEKPFAKPNEVKPWRFERRLSLMLRPLLECTDSSSNKYVYGAGTLRDSIMYIFDATLKGKFDKDVFSSPKMRSYIGKQVDERGAAFTQMVATKLKSLGWKTDTEIKMSGLGAGKKVDLGDIDVIAWKEDTGQVMAIECKRLKTARTIAEIALNCERFRGNKGDSLFKHMRRIEWLNENKDKLARFLTLSQNRLSIRGPLITNVSVPFKYLSDLTINPKDIFSFTEIEERI